MTVPVADGPSGQLSGGESGPALGAPRIDHFPTATGRHACAESVGARPFDSAGLEGTFHGLVFRVG